MSLTFSVPILSLTRSKSIFIMFKKIINFLTPQDGADKAIALSDEEFRLAAAALLVHVSMVDGDYSRDEQDKVKTILKDRFELSNGEVSSLLIDAEQKEREAVDIYGFTRVLARELDQDGRQKIVEMLWQVTFADGIVHEFENNLVWRSAELLGVSTRDRINLKKKVEGEL